MGGIGDPNTASCSGIDIPLVTDTVTLCHRVRSDLVVEVTGAVGGLPDEVVGVPGSQRHNEDWKGNT